MDASTKCYLVNSLSMKDILRHSHSKIYFLVLISVFSVYKFNKSSFFYYLCYYILSSSIPSTIHSLSVSSYY